MIQIEDGPTGQLFEFVAEEPPLDLVALTIFHEFFSVKPNRPNRTQRI
jgi:hypothetical protein